MKIVILEFLKFLRIFFFRENFGRVLNSKIFVRMRECNAYR